MRCPHCLENFTEEWNEKILQEDALGYWSVHYCTCDNDECGKIIIKIGLHENSAITVWPKGSTRPPLASEIPADLTEMYKKAALVLADSPEASAALSRRCLQHLIRSKAGITRAKLSREIEDLVAAGILPSHLSEQLNAVRTIGNFAAHPEKDEISGAIVEVEDHEAEWNLDVLDGLFDFYFVLPAKTAARKAALNAKLVAVGKAPLE